MSLDFISNTRKMWHSIGIFVIVVIITTSNKNIVSADGQNMKYETCANSLPRPGPTQGSVTSVVEFEGAEVTCYIFLGSRKKNL